VGSILLRIQLCADAPAPDPVYGSPVDRVTTYVYEPVHNKVIQKTDPDGYVTNWSYDANGNLLSLTDALGDVTSYTYNAQGLQLTKTDPNGNVTQYAYDTSGNLARTTDAMRTFFDQVHDGAGNVIQTIDATGLSVQRTRTSYYDGNNRVIKTVSATGQSTTSVYDPNGNLAQFTDAAGNVTTSVYDTMNRLASVTTPDSGTRSYTYDNNNNRLTETDAAGATTSYVYDAANRVIATTDGIGATRTMSYDLRDDAITVTDARGNINIFGYDILKRVSSRLSPDNDGVEPFKYQYDRRDNLTASASPTGQYNYISYDGLSRLTGDQHRSPFYDKAGNVVAIASNGDSGVTLLYAYDALNRRTSESYGFYGPFSLTFAYDPLSRRSSVTDNFGAVTQYAYDGEDRLLTLTTPWGLPITQSYDPAGRPLRMAYPNGLDADLSFETGTGRLASVTYDAGSPSAPIAQFNHTYDVRGNLSTLAELTDTKSFTYDPIERLTGVTQTNPSPALPVESYTYDTEGNRVATLVSPAYVTDPANRVLDDGINTYAWSPDGSMTSRTPKANSSAGITFQSDWYAYFNQARLDTIGGAFPMRFLYDPQGRNVFRAFDYSPALGQFARYHDGPDMVLEQREAGSSSPQWVRYVHGPGVDQPLALEIYPVGAPPTPGTGSQYYFHADGEGSIRLLTDANAQVANEYSYDSYGQRLTAVESVTQPFGWKGREWIPGPDIYYSRFRFYDPAIGRFASEDPIGYAADDWNFYSFVWNNPKRWRDAKGLEGEEEAGAAGAGTAPIVPQAVVASKVACFAGTVASALAAVEDTSSGELVALTVEAGACAVAAAYAKGIDAEQKVGKLIDGGIKQVITINGRKRIPDAIRVAQQGAHEAKAAAYQSLSAQLRDYIAYARTENFTFYLWVYPNTIVSGAIKQAIKDGDIVLQYVPK